MIKIKIIKLRFLIIFLIVVILPIIIKYLYYICTRFERIIILKEKFKNDKSFFDNGLLLVKDDKEKIFNVTNLFFKYDFNKEQDYKKLKMGRKFLVKGYGKILNI